MNKQLIIFNPSIEDGGVEKNLFLISNYLANKKINVPPLSFFDELLKGSDNRQISTTMAFVRLLTILVKDKNIGKLHIFCKIEMLFVCFF